VAGEVCAPRHFLFLAERYGHSVGVANRDISFRRMQCVESTFDTWRKKKAHFSMRLHLFIKKDYF
jgi:hypothetical protein